LVADLWGTPARERNGVEIENAQAGSATKTANVAMRA
jgi:hypothetical protein